MRNSSRPRSWQAASQSGIKAPMSRGRNVCKSSTPSIGNSTGSSLGGLSGDMAADAGSLSETMLNLNPNLNPNLFPATPVSHLNLGRLFGRPGTGAQDDLRRQTPRLGLL